MESFFKTLVEHGDKLSSTVILLLGFVAVIYGLLTENLEIGPPVKRKNLALKEANDALAKAKDELNVLERQYDRLEWETEHGWYKDEPESESPRKPAARRSARNRTRQ